VARGEASVRLGLAANWRQFALLVAVNAFVGGMVGLERTVVPLLAGTEFGVASTTAALSFIASFGLAKALADLVAGRLSERFSRRSVLLAGWLCGLPVPFALILAPSWGWVVGANVLLGLNQGLAWSMTVTMKMDLVGPARRGVAMGLNEAAGYLAVAGAAYLTGAVAERYGARPEPFYLGIGLAAAGTALSALLVRDTAPFVRLEAGAGDVPRPSLRRTFAAVSGGRRDLLGVAQAGLVNNLNDVLAWGTFPVLFAARGLSVERIGVLAAAYPLVWASLQLVTGWAGDLVGRKALIVGGMVLQGAAISAVGLGRSFEQWLGGAAALGLGTALVYPTLLAAVGDAVPPAERATALGVYRFWRDLGTVVGALSAGAVADAFGLEAAVHAVAALTAASGLVAAATVPGGRLGRGRRGGPFSGRSRSRS
jgi:MFS family permease